MTALEHGVQLFRDGQFFECHEVLEEEWKREQGPRRVFLQALIHIAVAYHHDQKGNVAGAAGQFRKGLQKLEPFLPSCEGIDTDRIYRQAHARLASL